jgi:hypothetical protein
MKPIINTTVYKSRVHYKIHYNDVQNSDNWQYMCRLSMVYQQNVDYII